MTTAPAAKPLPTSRTGGVIERLDNLFNWVFSTSHRAAVRRRRLMIILGLLAWILLTSLNITNEAWRIYLQFLFTSILRPGTVIFAPSDILVALFNLSWAPLLRMLLLLVLPFLLALWAAAVYLDDIFELNDPSIARSFILQAAFSGGYRKLRIIEGDVAKQDVVSPIYKIGGPGHVLVGLDSVALFEKADGTPRVIGPTVNERYRVAILDGFERLRMVIDLRNQVSEPLTVESRSLDGILVTAHDVRMVFSILRGDNSLGTKPTLERPYPFSEEAVKRLVYNQTIVVTPEQAQPQSKLPLATTMPAMIRGELGAFISRRGLSEFLANIGQPEVTTLGQREMKIAEAARDLTGDQAAEVPGIQFELGPFVHRPQITNLFYDFDSEFRTKSQKRGVQLQWVGVGTFNTLSEIIISNHLEAWQISRDNYMRGHPETLKELEQETALTEYLRLIQEMPLSTFRNMLRDKKSPQAIIDKLFMDYHERLRLALEHYARAQIPPPSTLIKAIQTLYRIKAHWV